MGRPHFAPSDTCRISYKCHAGYLLGPSEVVVFLFSLLFACAAEGDAAAGGPLFDDNCAVCHSADGSGGSGPDIRSVGSDEIVDVATDGKESMPEFGSVLSTQDIADIAAYVTTDLAD